MNQRLIQCDGSEYAFSLRQDGRDWVAVLHFRGEPMADEFRESSPDLLRLAIARWLLRLSADVEAML